METQSRLNTESVNLNMRLCTKHRVAVVPYVDDLPVHVSDLLLTMTTELVKCEDCFVDLVIRTSSGKRVTVSNFSNAVSRT